MRIIREWTERVKLKKRIRRAVKGQGWYGECADCGRICTDGEDGCEFAGEDEFEGIPTWRYRCSCGGGNEFLVGPWPCPVSRLAYIDAKQRASP